MQCVAEKNCLRYTDEGVKRFFMKGETHPFEKCPSGFRPLEGEDAPEIDFLTASEAELKAATWKFADANKAMQEAYGVELKQEPGMKKSEVVTQILDIRYRNTELTGPQASK